MRGKDAYSYNHRSCDFLVVCARTVPQLLSGRMRSGAMRRLTTIFTGLRIGFAAYLVDAGHPGPASARNSPVNRKRWCARSGWSRGIAAPGGVGICARPASGPMPSSRKPRPSPSVSASAHDSPGIGDNAIIKPEYTRPIRGETSRRNGKTVIANINERRTGPFGWPLALRRRPHPTDLLQSYTRQAPGTRRQGGPQDGAAVAVPRLRRRPEMPPRCYVLRQ